MKFPYISVEPVVAEVLSQLKKLMRTVTFNDNDCYTFAIDAARQIGGNNYDSDVAYITISKFSGFIPKNFYLLNHAYLCSRDTSVPATVVRPSEVPLQTGWIKSSIIYPADLASLRHCNRDCRNRITTKNAQGYTLKIPPGIIRYAQESAVICLEYLKLPMIDGIVMIQDEINCILAVQNYIKMMLLQEKFMMGEVPETVYKTIKQEWEDYLGLAQQSQKFPDSASTDARAIEQDQKYRKFRYR